MARHNDRVAAEVKKVRRKLSTRLLKAEREGGLLEEMRAIEREGERAYRQSLGTASKRRRHRHAE